MTIQTIDTYIPAARFGVLATLVRLAAAVRRRWADHRDRAHLMALSDQHLRDIGLSRGEIDRAVRFGRFN